MPAFTIRFAPQAQQVSAPRYHHHREQGGAFLRVMFDGGSDI
jgi:hypothetical protein